MHLHVDCQFGMAGDMLLAALTDAGADIAVVQEVLRALPLGGFEVDCRRTTRGGVAAMLVDVKDLSQPGHAGDDKHHHGHGHDHGHDHEHDHPHEHGHDHADTEHTHGHGRHHGHGKGREHGGPHRHLGDLLDLLEAPILSSAVKERAARVFRTIAEAEASVHGVPVDQVHFHEISGIDTAVDVIGSCIALDLLGVESITASAPSVGSGMVMCEHGIFPVPAPATLEILKSHSVPWRTGGEGERATPTGVALLAGLAESFGDAPEMTVTRIGYGAGHRDFADVPNLLRVIVGKPGGAAAAKARTSSHTIIAKPEPEDSTDVVRLADKGGLSPAAVESLLPGSVAPDGDRVVEFLFVVDDMTSEAVAFLCESCLASGALEAYSLPAMMKKGRPGHEVTVLSAVERAATVAEVIWQESSTFGMRVGERSRLTLAREFRNVAVFGQRVRIKLGWHNGAIIRRQPEFEDCRAAAAATGKTLREIFDAASRAAEDIA